MEMERWRKADGRVRMLFRRTRLARELDEEMRFHLEHVARSLHEDGLPQEAAAREARRRFGNALRIRERSMETWGFGWAESVAQDLRFGMRMLLRRPVFASVVIAVLGLGIGLNAAMFSIVEAVILRPLPYRDAKQLTIVWQSSAEHRATGEWFDSYRDFEEWQRRSRSFVSLAALSWASGPKIAEWRGKRERVLAIPVSSNFFSMLGVHAQYGRVFESRDTGSCAVVVSYAYWRNQLGAEKNVPGQNLTLDRQACLVVGVMAERFSFYPRETSLWTVITPQSEFVQQPWKSPTAVLGRLRRGVSRAAAEQELAAIESSIARERPRSMVSLQSVPVVLDLQREFTWLAGRNLRQGLTMLSAAVALVLLIVCVNVASLLLGRSAERQREMAIRASIGCGRARMMRQLLTEALVLSMCGAAAGVGLAEAVLRIFRAMNPVELPPGNVVEIRWQVLLLVAVLSLLCTLVCGVVPAWRASGMDPTGALKSDARCHGVAKQRGAKVMVMLQVALSLVLLNGATLLATSLARLSNESLGYRADHLLTADLSLPMEPAADADARERESEAMLQRVSALTGVQSAALASTVLPLGSDVLSVPGKTFDARSAAPNVASQVVSTEYLRTAEVPLLAGRNFTSSDRKGTQAVAMINARLAREYFPAVDALGRQIKLGSPEDHSSPQLTVVGIVGDVKTTNVFREMGHISSPVVYLPMAQAPGQAATLVVRTAAEPMEISEQVRQAVTSVDRDTVLANMKAMQTILHEQSAPPRFRTGLLGGFAGIALVLAALGIYGLLTQQVMRRTLEIGIRMALGENKRKIVERIVRQALNLTAGGIVLGIVGSFAAARVISGLLYETSASDPWLLGAAIAVFVVVALGASAAPAWRASSVDPIVSMRAE